MTKISKFQTNAIRIDGFEFSSILDLFGYPFVSDFVLRIFSVHSLASFAANSSQPSCSSLSLFTPHRAPGLTFQPQNLVRSDRSVKALQR